MHSVRSVRDPPPRAGYVFVVVRLLLLEEGRVEVARNLQHLLFEWHVQVSAAQPFADGVPALHALLCLAPLDALTPLNLDLLLVSALQKERLQFLVLRPLL